MSTTSAGASPEKSSPHLIGAFHLDVKSDLWTWSTEIFAMLGYRSGEVEPSTGLLRRHRHPESDDVLTDLIDQAVVDGESFAGEYRIRAADGRSGTVTVIGTTDRDENGDVTDVHGYLVDVTSERAAESVERDRLTGEAAGLHRALESRAPIEQAKGMIMLSYGCDAPAAFQVLIDVSQKSNTKLQTLATRLLTEMQTGVAQPDSTRAMLEEALLRLGAGPH